MNPEPVNPAPVNPAPASAAGCERCDGGVRVVPMGGHLTASICECIRRCPHCGGSARLFSVDSLGREYADPCSCQRARTRAMLIENASLPARFASAQLHAPHRNRHNREVFASLTLMAKEYTPESRGVVLMGRPGVGKTWLAAAYLRELIDRHLSSVLFRDFFHLLADLRSGYNRGRAEEVLIAPLVDVEVLLIDELGKGRNTPWEQSILDTIITLRYNAGKSCVFTTNYAQARSDTLAERYRTKEGPLAEGDMEVRDTLVERIGERILSRLQETCEFLLLKGPDRRTLAQPPA